MEDEFGYRSAIPSDGLNWNCLGVRPDAERVFQIVGTVEVSEYGLTRSRNKQKRLKTGGRKEQTSGKFSGSKPHGPQEGVYER